MNAKILVDSIVNQTTLLIAQLTTSGGIRAPMARLADEVFLTLSEELENQGVSRQVVADMFGMAIRGYQKRVQRLRQESTEPTTLWKAALDYIERESPVEKSSVLFRFAREDPNAVRSVLQDLTNSGLVRRQRAAGKTRLVALKEDQRRALARSGDEELVERIVWLDLARHPQSRANDVIARLSLEEARAHVAIASLCEGGHVQEDSDGVLTADSLFIPVGSEAGWEAALFDHFQAVCGAMIAKLRAGRLRSKADDSTGGLTLRFRLHQDHPELRRVLSLWQDTLQRADEVWNAVEEWNKNNPVDDELVHEITFYAGQFRPDDEEKP